MGGGKQRHGATSQEQLPRVTGGQVEPVEIGENLLRRRLVFPDQLDNLSGGSALVGSYNPRGNTEKICITL